MDDFELYLNWVVEARMQHEEGWAPNTHWRLLGAHSGFNSEMVVPTEALRRVGPGFEFRMPGMDLDAPED